MATLGATAAALAPAPSAAQEPATLVVVVREVPTGAPLRNAMVSLVEMITSGLTNEDGVYRRGGLPSGPVTVVVSSIGYGTVRSNARLLAGDTTRVEIGLPVQPVEHEPIEVITPRGDTRSLQEFYERVERGGSGHFITRAEIVELHPRQFSDLMRGIPGVRLDCSNWQHCTLSTRSTPVTPVTGDCPVQVYVNGIYQPYTNVNLLDPDHIEGVEVYPRGRGAPGRYTMRRSTRCGIILIWLRRSL